MCVCVCVLCKIRLSQRQAARHTIRRLRISSRLRIVLTRFFPASFLPLKSLHSRVVAGQALVFFAARWLPRVASARGRSRCHTAGSSTPPTPVQVNTASLHQGARGTSKVVGTWTTNANALCRQEACPASHAFTSHSHPHPYSMTLA